jgi:hypothetical protein
MQQSGFVQGLPMVPPKVALPLRFLDKLVLEVLPAALASVIGGLLFAHYQFGQLAAPHPDADAGGTASAAMVQLVRDEHAMLRQFLDAQQAADQRRIIAADQQDARAAAAARMAEAAKNRVTAALAAPPRSKATVAAAVPIPAPAPLVVARADLVAPAAAAPAAPARRSLVATTLALPADVVAVTLHAVTAIGGIPSWIGHRLGDRDRSFDDRPPSAAS